MKSIWNFIVLWLSVRALLLKVRDKQLTRELVWLDEDASSSVGMTQPVELLPDPPAEINIDLGEPLPIPVPHNTRYSEFLFIKLFGAYFDDELVDVPYDLMYGRIIAYYNDFDTSPFNDESTGLYSCIVNYLDDYRDTINVELSALTQ